MTTIRSSWTSPAPQPTVTAREFVQRFSSTPRAARLARLLTVEQLDAWGVPRGTSLSDAAAVVVAELGVNAVTHGRVPGRDFELRLTLDACARSLRVAVSDPRGERLLPPADLSADFGNGLLIVSTMSTDWGVEKREPSAKTVWAELPLLNFLPL